MSPDIKPGSWSDGSQSQYDEFAEQFRQEIEQSRSQKDDLINQSLISGKITPEMSSLLRAIRTSTGGNYEYGNLRKIQFVLAFREQFSIPEGERVAYIGAGTDWQFPVALGTTDIDMVDMSYPEIIEEMVENIKGFDQNPIVVKDEEVVKSIEFNINLGQGEKRIRLHTVGGEAGSYSSSSPLAGVVEAFGPSKSNDGTSPVLPNVAEALRKGSLILNLDFNRTRLSEGSGLEDIGQEDMAFYRVLEPKNLWKISLDSKNNAHYPSVDAIRRAIEESKQ